MSGQVPVMVINQNAEREVGHKAQKSNIVAATTISKVIQSCLGPRSMSKMILDPMGGIVMTNDGNAILREIDVKHPASQSMIDLSRTQDEEVGDGTTSVVILAGEMLTVAEEFLDRKVHPINICRAYTKALEDSLDIMESLATSVNTDNEEEMMDLIRSALGTKFSARWGDLVVQLALDAVRTVSLVSDERTEVDIKRYAKVEKVPGGTTEESTVLNGVMLNKDITHSKMRRKIENPRIILLDGPLEYKKGESKTDIEMMKEEDFLRILQQEEEQIERMCNDLLAHNPDIVITEKGCSDLAQHFLVKANVTVLRRVRKSDNNRIARVCGATICHRPDEVQDSDVGTGCGLFEIRKIGDEYFTFLEDCADPKACTILLRGASKDVLNEVERNLHDAMNVARNVIYDPRIVPGGGAVEMAVAHRLRERANAMEGVQAWPYKGVAKAFEVIPRTLIQNSGANVIRTMTALRAKHATSDDGVWGVDGVTGEIRNSAEAQLWEAFQVKVQTFKSAIEQATMLLRIDDIVQGLSRRRGPGDNAPDPSQDDPDAAGPSQAERSRKASMG